MFNFKGKVALITGGAKGIGACIAKELLRNDLKGVALLDNDVVSGTTILKELGNEFSKDRVIFINTDVTQRSQFEGAFEQTIQTFNGLDIVINNAGIFHELQWEKCIAVNLQGCVTGSLLALDKYFPKTLGSSSGIILNVASVLGLTSYEFGPVYSATKHGIIGFSRSLSGPQRIRGQNVRIVCICPGRTMTSIGTVTTDQLEREFQIGAMRLLKNSPMQTPEDVAQHAISIMKSANTGSVWSIDGNISKEIEFPTIFSIS